MSKDLRKILQEKLCDTINEAIQVQKVDNRMGIRSSLPDALARKHPNPNKFPVWAFLFPRVD